MAPMTTTGGAPSTTVDSRAGVGTAYTLVTLPTGERLLRRGEQEWSQLDRSLTGAQILRLGSRTFVFPRSVQPVLGTVLAPELFDVFAIATHPSGLPVTVTLAGGHEKAAVPGVEITSRSGTTAVGRITARSSAAMGSALQTRRAADLYAGILRIAPVEAARGATAPARYPMHTLTVSVTGADGRPLTAAMAAVVCTEDPMRFTTIAQVRNGRVKVSVPSGTYAVFTQSEVTPTDVRIALSPEFTISGDRGIDLDLRRATTHLRTHTAEPTTITMRVTLLRRTYETEMDGQPMHLLFDLGAIDDGAFDVAVTPTPKPRFGSQDFYQFVDAYARGGMAAGRFAVLYGHSGAIPRHDIVQTADDSNLATFNTTLYGPRGMTSGRFGRSAMPAGGGWGYLEIVDGPMRLRIALAKSKNLVTIRVLQAIGPQYAQDYIAKFGFDPRLHPAYLTMGLGAGAATPVQMGGAYAVFANGGYRIAPYMIAKITDAKGNVLSEADPPRAGDTAEQAIDPRNAFVMTTLLKDVVAIGTATRAQSLGRKDIAGKTGTTNENVDAWFCGYTSSIVGIAWIGFDQPRTLGTNETGAVAALPIWMSFMQRALKGVPEKPLEPPPGVVQVRINDATGLRDDSSPLTDWFFAESVPRGRDDTLTPAATGKTAQDVRNQLF